MSIKENTVWLDRAKALLEDSTQHLDAATLSRLNRARQAALAQTHTQWRPGWFSAGWVGACAVLLLALAMAPVWRNPVTQIPPSGLNAQLPIEDADWIATDASDDAMELYQNLDFYAWLNVEEQDAEGG